MPIEDDVIGFEIGMANYIKECAKNSLTLSEFYEKSSTKRYTKSRIKRATLASIIGMNERKNLDYIRVLGFNENGAKILKEIKEKSPLNVVVKTADFDVTEKSMFKYDILATDLAYFSSKNRIVGMDYKTSPVIM
jgi:predicted nucleotidyltransferase